MLPSLGVTCYYTNTPGRGIIVNIQYLVVVCVVFKHVEIFFFLLCKCTVCEYMKL